MRQIFKDKKKFAQKSFYVVLLLCVITVAITGYVVTKDAMDMYASVADYAPEVPNRSDDAPAEIPTIQMANGEETAGEESAQTVQPEEKPPEPKQPDPPKEEPKAEQTETAARAPSSEVTPLYIWPVKGEVVNPFSRDELLYSRTMNDWRAHMGIDIKATVGTPVKTMANGEVSDIYYDEMLGHVVEVAHLPNLKSRYTNLSPKIPVSVGQMVQAGDVIGGVGESAMFEMAEVSHLHFEVIESGRQVDPMEYIK